MGLGLGGYRALGLGVGFQVEGCRLSCDWELVLVDGRLRANQQMLGSGRDF